MANVQKACPGCKNVMEFTESQIGSMINCPFCGTQFQVSRGEKSTAALILGILGLVFSLLFSGIGLILSVIALIIGCTKKYKPGIIMGAIGVGLNIITLIVTVVVISFGLEEAKASGKKAHCTNNLKQIGVALATYENDYGVYPVARGTDGLELLRTADYLPEQACYTCPAAKNGGKSYVFLGDGISMFSADASAPVVIERPGNHKDLVGVTRVDGSCYSVKIPESMTTIRQITEYLLDEASITDKKIRARLLENAAKYD